MSSFIKGAGSVAFGIAGFLAFISLPAIFFIGLAKTSQYVLPWVSNLAWFCVTIIVLILLPLSLFKRFRVFTGTAIYITSFVFGLLLFLFSLLTTWSLWGGFWAVVGLLGFGGLVIPFALVACLVKGFWLGVGVVVGLLILTWGTRLGGIAIAMKGNNQD
ncbi:hypothetical protein [Pseudomonas viridiflava]|uniref:hypothetical protein n=1 Tax=Pseudomonas viridiflava TaxID=33069 RepID=UPI0013CE4D9D|nr:hypothetical protein [Pseudomonas viridiflava]